MILVMDVRPTPLLALRASNRANPDVYFLSSRTPSTSWIGTLTRACISPLWTLGGANANVPPTRLLVSCTKFQFLIAQRLPVRSSTVVRLESLTCGDGIG